MGFSYDLVNTPSLPLGTAEATILEVATGYAAFANGGNEIEPYMIQSIKTSEGKVLWKRNPRISRKRILSEHTCKAIGYMLQKAVNEGTGSPLRSIYGVSVPIAGKTGTTQDYTDAWFASFNPSIVIVSRVGASNPSVRFSSGRYGTGSSLALPLVALTLKKVQNNPKLNEQLNRSFSGLDAYDDDCPDYKEESGFDEFIKLFRREKMPDSLRIKKKKPFFKRLFGNP
jgi:penicillin-binding protein 1A